jgi:hypothetical protein
VGIGYKLRARDFEWAAKKIADEKAKNWAGEGAKSQPEKGGKIGAQRRPKRKKKQE